MLSPLGKDYSRGPKEVVGVIYVVAAGVTAWFFGIWWGLGLLVALIVVPASVRGWREGTRQARAAAIREGRIRNPVLIAADAAERGDIDVLIAALRDPEARGGAALDLGKLRAGSAVPQLIQNLGVHDDFDRNAAVIALGKIGDPTAIPALRELVSSDAAAGVRATAIDALASLGDAWAREQLGQLAVDPMLIWEGSERYMDAWPVRRIKPGLKRSTQRWAAKQIRALRAVEALPVISAPTRPVGPRQRVRLYRTVRALRRMRRELKTREPGSYEPGSG